MRAIMFKVQRRMEIRLENGDQFFNKKGETEEDFIARIERRVWADFIGVLECRRVKTSDLKKLCSTRLVEYLGESKDVEQAMIERVIASRNITSTIRSMDEKDQEFYRVKDAIGSFKKGLKALVLKHKITISQECEYLRAQDDCDGVGTLVDYLEVEGGKWYFESLTELTKDCFKKQP